MFTLNPTPSSNNAENAHRGTSDIKDLGFGGNREWGNTSDDSDYTRRTGDAPNIKENPVDETTRDIDDMADPKARKRDFSIQETAMNTQLGNEASFITKSDSDNRPRMDEGSDAVQIPETDTIKRHRKPNQWWYTTRSEYKTIGYMGYDEYEGEVR